MKVGGIDYLNSRPLLEGLASALGAGAELENWAPSELARRLRAGALDAGLVPVVEYFRGPADYRIVPGISIASYGPVESIRLFHRLPLGQVKAVGLDRSSQTSSLLVKLLFAEVWAPGRPAPFFAEVTPDEGASLLRAGPGSAALRAGGAELEGVLLIGDRALEFPSAPGWEIADLGTEWTRWTGLPFVYALWICREGSFPGPAASRLATAFARARDSGSARIDAIVERGPLPAGMSAADARRYLHRVLHYELGPAEIEGLLAFRDRARARGLLPPGSGELRFLAGEPRDREKGVEDRGP